MSEIIDNYQNVQQDILETFVDRGQLRQLAEPTRLPSGKRIPGLKLDHPRQLAVMHSLVRFANLVAGGTFTTADLYGPALDALGEYDRVVEELDRIGAQGNGAMRQLRAWRKRREVMDVIAEAAAATLS